MGVCVRVCECVCVCVVCVCVWGVREGRFKIFPCTLIPVRTLSEGVVSVEYGAFFRLMCLPWLGFRDPQPTA